MMSRRTSEMPEDFAYFTNYSFELEELRDAFEIKSLEYLRDINLSDDASAVILMTQLELRESVIDLLKIQLDSLVAKGCELEGDANFLKKKVLSLERKAVRRNSERKKYKYKNENEYDSLNKDKDPDWTNSETNGKSEESSSVSTRCESPSLSSGLQSQHTSNSKGENEDNKMDKIKAMVANALKVHGIDISNRDQLEEFKASNQALSSDEEGEIHSEDEKISDVGWTTEGTQSITEQVEATASAAVAHSGYVYQEELGLYYDHNSGYYYNAENGLYYDPKTGTYFYYNHETQAYQFHSQIPVETDADSSDTTSTYQLPDTKDIPPSLRLMVIESGVDRVTVGELHLVTMHGGKVGRGAHNLVQLLDVNVSEEHAEFVYHSNSHDDHHYFVKDLGSTNGTFINNTCICVPGEPSDEIEIGHGWELQFGTIKLKCHIHPGHLSCNECEPGLVRANLPAQQSSNQIIGPGKAATEKSRTKVLKAIKKKYAINPHVMPTFNSSDYLDRSKKRRKEKGSDNPYEKTEVASTDTAIRDNNKGFALLKKMGWSKGQALGKSQPGIVEPIEVMSTVGREGLGYGLGQPPPTQNQVKRKKILDLTTKRFDK